MFREHTLINVIFESKFADLIFDNEN